MQHSQISSFPAIAVPVRVGEVERGMLMAVWRPTPFPLMSSHLGFMSSHLGFTVLLPYSQQPWNHFMYHSLYMSAHGGSRKLPQLGSGEPGCQARPKDTKAHLLATAPARRYGKGHAGGRHSASKGPEAGRSDVQGVIK